jgi:hypothetical protein
MGRSVVSALAEGRFQLFQQVAPRALVVEIGTVEDWMKDLQVDAMRTPDDPEYVEPSGESTRKR